MGKNPFDEVEAANNARFAEFLKTRQRPERTKTSYQRYGEDEPLYVSGGMITRHKPGAPEDEATKVENMRECIGHAADYYAKETGFAADRFIALIDVNELLAAESPMAALEAALTAGEAKIRGESQ